MKVGRNRTPERGLNRRLFSQIFIPGSEYLKQLQRLSPTALHRHAPIGKDWNEDLLFCVKENS